MMNNIISSRDLPNPTSLKRICQAVAMLESES
jgi:hypothetical protein